MGLPKASLTQREASCGEQKDKHTRAHMRAHTRTLEAPALPWSLPSPLLPEAHQRWGTGSGTHKPLERWPPPHIP